MLKKVIALYMSFYLLLPGIIPVNSAFAQNNAEYTIAILNLDAKGVSQVEAGSFIGKTSLSRVTTPEFTGI